ncbi:phosphoglycerate mutase [Dyella psychrodurans]|uniref:Phosphoglycerate mutase n=1 Tax=Dyella psychrodurans TaxID=1927960 RepID=A0A370XD50_9GAMM|nr:phosphoglycerate mutase [Dyella psychrodurans]RDS86373.1 phosphoglycerate mutase [Dyella psychrodurans]
MTDTSFHAVECWLPNLERFEPAHPLRRLLAKADRLDNGAQGYLNGLAAYFQCGDGMPAAALTRDHLAGDAAEAPAWLSADPAWVQPDLSGARLLACGQMQLSMDEARSLAEPLKPIFADAGMSLEVSSPDRWHVRLPSQNELPEFAAPEQALGEDLYNHLPHGPEGRRWRVLFNEVQVMLHQHPANAQRRARGLPPVNSVWLWGGGALPSHVSTTLKGVIGEDLLLLALAQHAGITTQHRSESSMTAAKVGWLIDLQDQNVDDIAKAWVPSLQALSKREALVLAFASGERWLHRPWHRMRFWRRNAS